MEAAVARRAKEVFFDRGIARTKGRDGVLIFASLLERRVIVLADEAVRTKVPPAAWDAAVAAMTTHAADGRVAKGLCAAVEKTAVAQDHGRPHPLGCDENCSRHLEVGSGNAGGFRRAAQRHWRALRSRRLEKLHQARTEAQRQLEGRLPNQQGGEDAAGPVGISALSVNEGDQQVQRTTMAHSRVRREGDPTE